MECRVRVGREAPVGPPSLPARSEATDDDDDDDDEEEEEEEDDTLWW